MKQLMTVSLCGELYTMLAEDADERGLTKRAMAIAIIEADKREFTPEMMDYPLAISGRWTVTLRLPDVLSSKLDLWAKSVKRGTRASVGRGLIAAYYRSEFKLPVTVENEETLISVPLRMTEAELGFIDEVCNRAACPSRQGYLRDAALSLAETLMDGPVDHDTELMMRRWTLVRTHDKYDDEEPTRD